ncbi:MAG: DUF4392 domain-containing protein [Halioglobus sp.]|nr:DUF4392 domain-containing protein [Halioglobus sp.]
MQEQQLSESIEKLLVSSNPRHMAVAKAALKPSYYLRGARHLRDITGSVIIGTGFPVSDTFETDGPVRAMALYQALETLGACPYIACGASLAHALATDYRIVQLTARDQQAACLEATAQLLALQPKAIVAIECPGIAADSRYYNMRGKDITAECFYFDPFINQANCPTIAIGDGGNEIGMGNIAKTLAGLDITASMACCRELLVADVSNWGAYGLIAFLGLWSQQDLLANISSEELFNYLSARGSVDGITGKNTLTEDGLPSFKGARIIEKLRVLTHFSPRTT